MAAPPEKIRPSATVLLTRRKPHLEVYLVERSRETRFFPGYHAFPGGVVDKSDGEGADARRRAALRELFEETGVLVTKPRAPAGFPRDTTRDDAHAALQERALEWDIAALTDAGRLVTPPFGPVRYDTSFFVCALPEGEEPKVIGGELVGGQWMRPREALRRWEEEAWPVPPPTLAYLHLLADHDDPAKAALAARATDGRPHHERFRIEFHPGIFVLPLRTRTLPPATTTNCYLVDGDPIVVVDPGPSEAEDLVPLFHTLDDMTRDGREVVVVLTHHHADHVGGAAATKQRYRARVLAHPFTGAALPSGLVDHVLQDNDVLDLGPWGARPWKLRALATPGHTGGHLVLRDERWGAILAGDLVSGVSTIMIDPAEGDMGQYMASLRRIADLKPPAAMPAHGPLMPGDAFMKTLEHRRMREEKVVAALLKDPQGIETLVAKAYDDTPPELHGLAARSLEAHLIDLQRQRRARRVGDTWMRA